MVSKLSSAKVFHKRNYPRQNKFLYNVYYLLLDLNSLKKINSKFLSLNKFNIFSYYEKDHVRKKWLKKLLQEEGIESKKIKLLTHPRLFGYVFNPVSFWFCFDEKSQLVAVLSEVNNTFKEEHSYLIFNKDKSPITKNQTHIAKKEFHVSPFLKRRGKYRFKFDYNEENIQIFIDYFDQKKLMLNTSMICRNEELSDKNLLKYFFKIPFLTFKVVFLIHYQALKIILKKIKYISKPSQFSSRITKNNE